MKFSLRLNSDLCGARRAVELSVLAEGAGFDVFWYCEDLFKRDGWIVLTAAAEATEKLGLGTSIVNPYTSHIAEIAMRAATLQELSGGRFHLGIGVGAPETLKWAGVHVERPVAGLVEAVKRLRLLLTGQHLESSPKAFLRFDYGGQAVPIYIGGQGRKLAYLMGALGDGGLPLIVPPEAVGKFFEWIGEGSRDVGKDFSMLDISGCIWYCIGENGDDLVNNKGLRTLITYYGPMLSDELIATAGLSRDVFERLERGDMLMDDLMRLAVTGTFDDVDKVVKRLKSLYSHGLRHFNIGPPLGDDPAKVIEFTGRVIRKMRGL